MSLCKLKGFPQRDECVYTKFYCEENIWKLCKSLNESLLKDVHVVFISNLKRMVPLWCQRAAKYEGSYVLWDYHVILVHTHPEGAQVYDFDTGLSFPESFTVYYNETMKDTTELQNLPRFFRVIPGTTFLSTFSSDRRHMKINGKFFEKPPEYEPIQTGGVQHNLDEFISMNPEIGQGFVLNKDEFYRYFSKKS